MHDMKKIFLTFIVLMISSALYAQEPQNVLKLGFGPGLTFHKDSPYYVQPHRYFRQQWGVEAGIGAERMLWRFIGAGLNIDYYHSKHHEDGFPYGYNNFYVGPCLVAATTIGRHIRIDGNAGLGYSLCSEPGTSKGTLGYRLSFGIEYMVSSHVGIGAEVVEHLTKFNGSDYLNRYGFTFNSVCRGSVLVGIRIYPKL